MHHKTAQVKFAFGELSHRLASERFYPTIVTDAGGLKKNENHK